MTDFATVAATHPAATGIEIGYGGTAGGASVSDVATGGTRAGIDSAAIVTCDTAKWASATACDGILKWGTGTLTEASGTTNGSVTAWMWLADMNPTSVASVFGVEKDDVINIMVYQHIESKFVTTAASVIRDDALVNSRSNSYGVATFTHAGANSTMLGAAALTAALLSFF